MKLSHYQTKKSRSVRLPNNAVLGIKKNIFSKRIIQDIQQFFNDNHLHVNKITKHGQGDSIKFYEIHFDNLESYDIDVITEKLDKYGYTPKSLHGNLPNSFYLLVLVNKKI